MSVEAIKSESPTPDQQKEILICYIERERDLWMNAKTKDERAAHMNVDAKRDRTHAMNKLNSMLETLYDDYVNVEYIDYGTTTS